MQCPPTKPGLKGKFHLVRAAAKTVCINLHQIEYFSQLVYESNINITLGIRWPLQPLLSMVPNAFPQ
jgi:hypothetical protein